MEKAPEFVALMKRVQEGSREAARELHERYGPHIRRAVRRRLHQRLRSKFDSLDFVQDVWASFFDDIPQRYNFEQPEDLISFLTAMAHNKVAQVTRQRFERKKYDVRRELTADAEPRGADRFPANQQTPSEIMMGREEWDRLLDKQPLVHRRILILLREGKSSANIAEELGISQRTVTRVLRKIVPESPGNSL